MAEQKPASKKKGCLGCSLPLAIGLIVVVVAISVIGIINGAFGKNFIPPPEVELPAEVVFHIGVFPVTNTIITSWITMLVLVLIALLVTRRSKLIPGRFQGAVESIIEYMYNFCKDVAGEKKGRTFFPIVTTIFLFVLINALMNLIPGYGTITFTTEEGAVPLLRGANTDINLPLALALVSFVMVGYYGIKEHKLKFIEEYIRFRALRKGPLGIIDVFVGILELLSVFIRILSFTFRLFGNMTAGEILILMIMFLVPWVAAVPFYGLELLVGYIQALIFAGLTLVFLTVATAHHEAE